MMEEGKARATKRNLIEQNKKIKRSQNKKLLCLLAWFIEAKSKKVLKTIIIFYKEIKLCKKKLNF